MRPAMISLALVSAACEVFFPTREAAPDGGAGQSDADADPSAGDAAGGADGSRPDAGEAGPGTSRSCEGLTARCGGDPAGDCCASVIVPGGTFKRSYDGVTATDPSHPATISSFRLDVFEVTVGRFRQWVRAYDAPGGKPSPGAGKNPSNAADPGWQASFDALLPADADALADAVRSCNGDTRSTFSDAGDDTLPINCLRWVEAFAFCIWDGGRLPTEAEWNLAAAGGDEQRVYPWSTPPSSTAIDGARAVMSTGAPATVGSKPLGAGRWGHLDLAGNVAEWTLDFKADYVTPCVDCAKLDPLSERIARGGGFDQGDAQLRTADRGSRDPLNRFANVGVRCARDP